MGMVCRKIDGNDNQTSLRGTKQSGKRTTPAPPKEENYWIASQARNDEKTRFLEVP